MESRQKILELVRRFEILPSGHEGELRTWIVDLNYALQEIFGPDSQYLQYLRYIKFHPEVVFVTDKERDRSWKEGVAQVDNLLHVILNDPKVSDQIMFDPDPADQEDASSEDRVRRSLEEFKESAAKQMQPLLRMDGAFEETLRVDVTKRSRLPDDRTLNVEDKTAVQNDGQKSSARILCVAGSNTAINDEVQKFLTELPAQVMAIPKAIGQDSLIDRLNKCSAAEFVVFILSADFHIYSKSQRPVDGGMTASQEAVFELGYLAARFNRQNMVVLYEESENFLRPTEFFDLFYVPVTPSGAWKAEVLRRMKGKLAIAAGLGLSVENEPNA